MSVQRALEVFGSHQALMLLPRWIHKLPIKRIRNYHKAKETLAEWMNTQAALRKEAVRDAAASGTSSDKLDSDCFTLLVKANEDEAQKFKLADDELVLMRISTPLTLLKY